MKWGIRNGDGSTREGRVPRVIGRPASGFRTNVQRTTSAPRQRGARTSGGVAGGSGEGEVAGEALELLRRARELLGRRGDLLGRGRRLLGRRRDLLRRGRGLLGNGGDLAD